jgi:hypothetical protein
MRGFPWVEFALAAPLAVFGLTACRAPAPIRIELPEDGAGSMVLLVEGASPRVFAIDLGVGGPSALPKVEGLEGDLRLDALTYDTPLAALGLSPGPIQPASAGMPTARPLPFQRGYQRVVSAADPGVWTPVAESATPFATLLFDLVTACPPGQVQKTLIAPKDPSAATVCVDPRPSTTCWGPVQRLVGLNPGAIRNQGGVLVEEAGQLWFYFRTDGMPPSGDRIVRELFSDSVTPIAGSLEELSLSKIGGLTATGSNAAPLLRRDGLEMVFNSTRPDNRWYYLRVYVAGRRSPTDPWSASAAAQVESILNPSEGAGAPVLLPDARTLVYFQGYKLTYAVRGSTMAGDPSFVRSQDRLRFDPHLMGNECNVPCAGCAPLWCTELEGPAMSCDGWHLIYRLSFQATGVPPGPYIAELVNLDPPVFSPPDPYPMPLLPDGYTAEDVVLAVESRDCKTLYLTLYTGTGTRGPTYDVFTAQRTCD